MNDISFIHDNMLQISNALSHSCALYFFFSCFPSFGGDNFSLNLQGFEGMLQYWADYRHLIDAFFSRMEVAKLSLENSVGDWPRYQQQVLQFLGLSLLPELSLPNENLDHFVGTYSFMDGDTRRYCAVQREQEHLFLDGVPSIWPNNRLIPLSQQIFAVDSFPVEVHFEDDACGNVCRMVMKGPEMFFCSVNYVFVREQEQTLSNG